MDQRRSNVEERAAGVEQSDVVLKTSKLLPPFLHAYFPEWKQCEEELIALSYNLSTALTMYTGVILLLPAVAPLKSHRPEHVKFSCAIIACPTPPTHSSHRNSFNHERIDPIS